MTAANPRAAAAPLIIAAALLAGGHLMLVDPAKRQLAHARAQSVQGEAGSQRLQAVQAALPALTKAEREARAEAARIEHASAPANDPGILFATLATLADGHGVRVDQLDPFVPRRAAGSPASAAHAAAPTSESSEASKLPPDIQLGYSMTVVAAYSDLAAFLRALQTDLGYTRILSVRMAPSPEGPATVTARIQTVHHAFSLPAGLAGGGPEDRP